MRIHFVPGSGFGGNIYLVDAEKPVIIDAGWDADLRHIEHQIDDVLGGRKLDKIILTHRHVDHVGGALAIRERWGGKFFAQKDEASALRSADQISTGARMFGSQVHPMEVSDISDGDKIDLGNSKFLKVIITPGHTEGSICLLTPGNDLFSGDTVFTDGGVGRWDLPTGDYKQLVASLEMLADLEIRDLYPGHGPFAKDNGASHIGLGLRYLREFGRFG